MSQRKKEVKSKTLKIGIPFLFFIVGFSTCLFFLECKKNPLLNTIQQVDKPFPSIDVCFTPTSSCLPKIVKCIAESKKEILILGYSFTSKPITKALIEAKLNRGVKVKIVLDHSQKSQKHSKEVIQELIKSRIEVRFDHSVKIAHNKVVIVDSSKVLTGSYNWTHSAEYKNAENLVFIKSSEIVDKYLKYFEYRWIIAK